MAYKVLISIYGPLKVITRTSTLDFSMWIILWCPIVTHIKPKYTINANLFKTKQTPLKPKINLKYYVLVSLISLKIY